VKFKQPEGFVFLKDLRGTKKEVSKNAGATLFDIGDGVGLVEFHTKMNALDDDIFAIAPLKRWTNSTPILMVWWSVTKVSISARAQTCSWWSLERSKACGIRSMEPSAACRD
jgi:hypothetical protein